jgi:RNA polymerase sigma-70 factor (ECF subfamily)
MLSEVMPLQMPVDDAVARLLLARAAEAHRLAAWILRDPVGAEDVVQEAALVAWSRRASLRNASSAEAWFNRIVVNACRDELRRRARRRRLPQLEPTADAPSDDFAVRDEIDRSVARLTPDEQVVLGLRFGRDLTIPQIAAQMGLPEGTVKSRLHHALEHVRVALAAERRAEELQR